MSYFVDIHTHSNLDRADTISIVNIEIDIDNYIGDINICSDNLYSIGIHPWRASSFDKVKLDLALSKIESIAKEREIFAIGEIGIDRSIDTPIESQIDLLKRQLNINRSGTPFVKPFTLHLVRANQDILPFIEGDRSFIIHGFRGNKIEGKMLTDRGCFLSYGDAILSNHSKVIESLKLTPIDNLFLETDSSDVDIRDIYSACADIRGCSISELRRALYSNFLKISNL